MSRTKHHRDTISLRRYLLKDWPPRPSGTAGCAGGAEAMTREEVQRAAEALASSPAAGWIGNKFVGNTLLQRCMRCGAEQTLAMTSTAMTAFQGRQRGGDVARHVPPDFDEKLFAWKRAFQLAHESCVESAA
jgi:hypothetical protein